MGACIGGYDFYDNDTNPIPYSGDGHGTLVAGVLGASLSNTSGAIEGVVGVNPSAKIMALRAGSGEFVTSLAAINAITFAGYNGARIINASFGGEGEDTALKNAIQDFADRFGGLFVTAAGNSN